jgi:hypothetical protein
MKSFGGNLPRPTAVAETRLSRGACSVAGFGVVGVLVVAPGSFGGGDAGLLDEQAIANTKTRARTGGY